MHVLSPEVHEAHGGGRGSRNDADVVVPSEAPFHHEQTLFCETRVKKKSNRCFFRLIVRLSVRDAILVTKCSLAVNRRRSSALQRRRLRKSVRRLSIARHCARRPFRRGSTRRAIGHAMFASPQRQGGGGAFGSGNAPAEEGGSGASRRREMSAKTSLTIPARPISDAAFPSPPPPRYRSRRAHAGSRSGHLQPAGRERRRGSRDAPQGGSARGVRVPAARGASPSRFFSSGRGRPHGVATTTRARTRGAFAVPRRGCRHGDVHSTRPSR